MRELYLYKVSGCGCTGQSVAAENQTEAIDKYTKDVDVTNENELSVQYLGRVII